MLIRIQVKAIPQTYEISAIFTEVSGLMTGADVRLSGIKIGSVTSQNLDDKHMTRWF